MRNCSKSVGSVPETIVACVRASDEMSDISVLEDTWEWFDVTVPVIRDFWSAHILLISMKFLLWKHLRGDSVGLHVSSLKEDVMLRRWLSGFGQTHTVLWFDVYIAAGGLLSQRRVTPGMFVWAVRCGIIGEYELYANLGRVGALLLQLVNICHGPGLVNTVVISFMRCVVGCACICLLDVFEASCVICFGCLMCLTCLILPVGKILRSGYLLPVSVFVSSLFVYENLCCACFCCLLCICLLLWVGVGTFFVILWVL